MAAPDDAEVLVVGAGPTGLTAAAQLLEHGVSCRLIDLRLAPSDKSRALVVHPRSLELLSRMGLSERLVSRGRTTVTVNVYGHRGRAARLQIEDLGIEDTRFPFLTFVSQAETEAVLRQRVHALGGRIEYDTELLRFSADGSGVLSTVRRGAAVEEIQTRYLVGADGAHSTVRKVLGLSFDGAPYPQEFLLADVKVNWPFATDELQFFFRRSGLCVCFPLIGHQRCRFVVSRGRVEASDEEPTTDEVTSIVTELTGESPHIEEADWLARFRLHHRGVDRYRAGPVFVAGDAAHIHSPAGGQGMNTGIQDAFNLAWKLALVLRAEAPETLLDTYHAERFPVGRRLLKVTDRLFQLGSSSSPVLAELRHRVVPRAASLVFRTGVAQHRAFRFVSQLGIRYRKSPAVAEGAASGGNTFRGGPRPGDRAPDAPVCGEDGVPGSLHAFMTGTPFHLLCFVASADTAVWARTGILFERHGGRVVPILLLRSDVADGPAGVSPTGPTLRDPDGTLFARYGLSGEGYVLVRPDGHVAFRSAGPDPAGLEAYLAEWLPRGGGGGP